MCYVLTVDSLYSQLVHVTVGSPLESRPFREISAGQVSIYASGTFDITGVVESWSVISTGASNLGVTPLLFERISRTDFILRAVGASRSLFGDGPHSFAFDPEAGEPIITPTFTFGLADRVVYVPENPSTNPIVTASRNAGAVDFGYDGRGHWYFTSNETFEIRLGQIYRLEGLSDGNVIRLQNDAPVGRSYSAQMSAWGRIPAVSATIHRAVEICWPSVSNRQYQVQWTPAVSTNWQNFGERIQGNGATNCVFDSTKHSEQRFYRVVPVP
jgi:hypothetical protein